MKYHYEQKWICKDPVKFGLWATASLCGTFVVLVGMSNAELVPAPLFIAMMVQMVFGGLNAAFAAPTLKKVRVYDEEPAPGAAPTTTDIKDQLKSNNLLED